jgi:hypothetical protein
MIEGLVFMMVMMIQFSRVIYLFVYLFIYLFTCLLNNPKANHKHEKRMEIIQFNYLFIYLHSELNSHWPVTELAAAATSVRQHRTKHTRTHKKLIS